MSQECWVVWFEFFFTFWLISRIKLFIFYFMNKFQGICSFRLMICSINQGILLLKLILQFLFIFVIFIHLLFLLFSSLVTYVSYFISFFLFGIVRFCYFCPSFLIIFSFLLKGLFIRKEFDVLTLECPSCVFHKNFP